MTKHPARHIARLAYAAETLMHGSEVDADARAADLYDELDSIRIRLRNLASVAADLHRISQTEVSA